MYRDLAPLRGGLLDRSRSLHSGETATLTFFSTPPVSKRFDFCEDSVLELSEFLEDCDRNGIY